MLEYWSAAGGLKRMLSILIYIVKTNFAINPTFHFPKTRYLIIPLFQHSN
jgi:hypothetical protein